MITRFQPAGDLFGYMDSPFDMHGDRREQEAVIFRGDREKAVSLLQSQYPWWVLDQDERRRKVRFNRKHLLHVMSCFSEKQKKVEESLPEVTRLTEALFLAGLPENALPFVWCKHGQKIGTHTHGGLVFSLLPRGGPYAPRMSRPLADLFSRLASRAMGLSDPRDPSRARLVHALSASCKKANDGLIKRVMEETDKRWEGEMLTEPKHFHQLLRGLGCAAVAFEGAGNTDGLPVYPGSVTVRGPAGEVVCFGGPVCRPNFSPGLWKAELRAKRGDCLELRHWPNQVFARFAVLLIDRVREQESRYQVQNSVRRICLEDFDLLKPRERENAALPGRALSRRDANYPDSLVPESHYAFSSEIDNTFGADLEIGMAESPGDQEEQLSSEPASLSRSEIDTIWLPASAERGARKTRKKTDPELRQEDMPKETPGSTPEPDPSGATDKSLACFASWCRPLAMDGLLRLRRPAFSPPREKVSEVLKQLPRAPASREWLLSSLWKWGRRKRKPGDSPSFLRDLRQKRMLQVGIKTAERWISNSFEESWKEQERRRPRLVETRKERAVTIGVSLAEQSLLAGWADWKKEQEKRRPRLVETRKERAVAIGVSLAEQSLLAGWADWKKEQEKRRPRPASGNKGSVPPRPAKKPPARFGFVERIVTTIESSIDLLQRAFGRSEGSTPPAPNAPDAGKGQSGPVVPVVPEARQPASRDDRTPIATRQGNTQEAPSAPRDPGPKAGSAKTEPPVAPNAGKGQSGPVVPVVPEARQPASRDERTPIATGQGNTQEAPSAPRDLGPKPGSAKTEPPPSPPPFGGPMDIS